MKMSIKKTEITAYMTRQLNAFFPDSKRIDTDDIKKYLDLVFERTEHCFSKVKNKYFTGKGSTLFNHLNADHYAMFLYFTANTLYRKNRDRGLYNKLFLLNRALHGVDAFYEVNLPDIFLLVHPMGTMIGRAHYSDYLVIYQQCTVGSNKGIYPRLGEYVSLHPGSAVLGNCEVGRNCKISAGSVLMDKHLKDNSVYIGTAIQHTIKTSASRLPIWG